MKKVSKAVWQSAEVVPVVIPAALTAFSAIAVFFIIIGQFKSSYVWTFGLLAAFASASAIVTNYPYKQVRGTARTICNVAVIAGVLAWGGFNFMYTSQHVMINRDPAIYTNTGIWLIKHDNLKIQPPDTFGNEPGVRPNSAGFKYADNDPHGPIYAQGQHLLPALMGLAGRIVGIAHSLHINVLFGMTAILAVYAFARELVSKTGWAAVAVAAFAASMPLIYFSRDMYSEPLAATFTFSALSLLWLAIKTSRPGLWFLAGIAAGAGSLTRIDGLLTVIELLAFAVIMLVVSKESERKKRLLQAAVFIVGMIITSLLGWIDVSQLSPTYYGDLHTQAHRENMVVYLVAILGVAVVVLSWRTRLLQRLERSTRPWRSDAVVVAIAATALLLLSEPLWHTNISTRTAHRNYAEIAPQWIGWYIGASMVLLGLVGVLLAANKALKRPRLLLTASLLVIAGTSALYLIQPSIAPDQIWASRRLLPVILPGFLCFAALSLDWLSSQFSVRYKKELIVISGVALTLPALVTSQPLLQTRTYTELGAVNAMCSALPKNAAVLWTGLAQLTLVQPTKEVCDVPSAGYRLKSPVPEHLANVEANTLLHGHQAVIGVTSSEVQFLPPAIRDNLRPVASYQYQRLERTPIGPPKAILTEHNTILFGIIKPDGEVVPL